ARRYARGCQSSPVPDRARDPSHARARAGGRRRTSRPDAPAAGRPPDRTRSGHRRRRGPPTLPRPRRKTSRTGARPPAAPRTSPRRRSEPRRIARQPPPAEPPGPHGAGDPGAPSRGPIQISQPGVWVKTGGESRSTRASRRPSHHQRTAMYASTNGTRRMTSTGDAPGDEELMRQVAGGSAPAARAPHGRFSRLIFAIAVPSLDRAGAEDLVQEVFLTVWRNAARFDPERGTVRAWILQIAHFRLLNELRRRSRQP